jgi:hypothetical protein
MTVKENLRKALRKQLDLSIKLDEAWKNEFYDLTERQIESLENRVNKANIKVKWAWKRVIKAAIERGRKTAAPELLESLENMSAAFETMLAHFDMPEGDRVQRERLLQEAKALT